MNNTQPVINLLDNLFGYDFMLNPISYNNGYRQLVKSTFPVDIQQTDESYEILADLPGFDKSQIDIDLDNHLLTIHAQHESKNEKCLVKERHQRSFKRSFSLPEDADADNIKASMEKGVLTVTVPKTQKTTTKIKIQ